MPAMKIPVKNRKNRSNKYEEGRTTIAALSSAPKSAHKKKTIEGLNLSAIDRMANKNVPKIKPNCMFRHPLEGANLE